MNDKWLNVMNATIVGANTSVATLYFTEGRWGYGLVWVFIALAWLVPVYIRTDMAYDSGRIDVLEQHLEQLTRLDAKAAEIEAAYQAYIRGQN